MRRDPTMFAIALIGTSCGLAATALLLYLGGAFSGHWSRARFELWSLVFFYPLTFTGVFFNVALVAAASAAMEGRWLGVGGALAEARRRLGPIAGWSLLSSVVGVLLSEIVSRLPAGGRLAAWLLGAAWGVATIFAIPILTLEDARPLEAARASANLAKSRWGEGLTGMVGIGLWVAVAALPIGIVGGVGIGIVGSRPALGVSMVALAASALVASLAAATATRQVFALALFRYATDVPTAGFELRDLEDPFTRRGEARGRRTRPWAWIVLALIAGLIVLGALIGPRDRSVPSPSDSPTAGWTYFSAAEAPYLRAGMAVRYRGRVVGRVFKVTQVGARGRFFVAYRLKRSLFEVGNPPIGLVAASPPFLWVGRAPPGMRQRARGSARP
ncbi:MAG TPA: DUF6159 family protein [Solirubrobacterales bacterium]|nr:DUF6159 family protein [Solirubrobacterales bacterium]